MYARERLLAPHICQKKGFEPRGWDGDICFPCQIKLGAILGLEAALEACSRRSEATFEQAIQTMIEEIRKAPG